MSSTGSDSTCASPRKTLASFLDEAYALYQECGIVPTDDPAVIQEIKATAGQKYAEYLRLQPAATAPARGLVRSPFFGQMPSPSPTASTSSAASSVSSSTKPHGRQGSSLTPIMGTAGRGRGAPSTANSSSMFKSPVQGHGRGSAAFINLVDDEDVDDFNSVKVGVVVLLREVSIALLWCQRAPR